MDTQGNPQGKSPTLNTKEAAELLRMHPTSLQEKLRKGEFAGIAGRCGRKWVFNRAALEARLWGENQTA